MSSFKTLQEELKPLKLSLKQHPLYTNINSVESIQRFMQWHVFAVWDFMSLLKSLQKELTCITTPWVPTHDRKTRRLINEIVLCEESDDIDGEVLSHFELYLRSMKQVGSDMSLIQSFLSSLNTGKTWREALALVDVDLVVREFLQFTFEIIETGKVHLIGSVFTFGREDLIPDMFIEMIQTVNQTSYENLDLLIYYFQRHIDIDGDEHGPMALHMMDHLCQDDEQKWKECIDVAKMALGKRVALWDGIHRLF